MTDREKLIRMLLPSGIDLDASDESTVVVETDRPNVFVEFRFDPADLNLTGLSVQDWNGVRRA